MKLPIFIILLLVLLQLSSTKVDHGKCGYQCTSDSDCTGCNSSGKCSCPDAALDFVNPAISCSCTSQPESFPSDPASDVNDSIWPSQWSADVTSWTYGDFSNKTAVAEGKFFYDLENGRSRADWTPYINGKDATQIWITDLKNGKSNYYVKSGFFCLYFPITDPGHSHSPVGVVKRDWMANCEKAGLDLSFVAREEILVDGELEWADHYSCHIEYKEVNQSITFQNWHSLGLGKTAKGLPLRVTGGNSTPSPTKGSPRLNSVWYSNFVTGPEAVSKKGLFDKPSRFCIPVGLQKTQKHFGFIPTVQHVMDGSIFEKAQALIEDPELKIQF